MLPKAEAQVTSVTGTANEVTASPTTGIVVLTIPNIVKIPSGSSSGASLQLPASTTSAASFNISPTSASAPTTPNAGDIWNVSSVLTFYGSSKKQNIITDGGTALSASQIAVVSASSTNQLTSEGPTIDGSANINSIASATGSGNATFASFITSGSSVGSMQFFNSGSTFSVTLTPAAAPTSNFTLDLPDVEANDTLASLGFAQTLSSKTLNNALFVDGAHSNATLFTTSGVASAVNNWQIGNSATGNGVVLSATGTDSNIGAGIAALGTGSVTLRSNGANALAATNGSSSAVNFASIIGSVAGTGVTYGVSGSDLSINLALTPKGPAGGVIVQSSIRTGSSAAADLAHTGQRNEVIQLLQHLRDGAHLRCLGHHCEERRAGDDNHHGIDGEWDRN